ncbi:peptidoglycan D,D-transpeptidase FtsI family protein [Thermophilibacter immobilis]|uniref:peptidoglycan D,D-transpeptidase FtsI family protein n=1 Tax=Thermophilibacter immobilis TaxID=2779519 RepID=UPI001E476ED8|nr:penicillin-binding protein 2 [Thermophilibacter immobilis]
MTRNDRQSRPRRSRYPEASYDEASRARYRERAERPGGSGEGGSDRGLVVTRRALVGLLGVVALRLAWLQVCSPDLAGAAEKQRTNVVTLHARRGTIYDRSGSVLAMSVECDTVYANPQEVSDPSGVADALVSKLGGQKADYMSLLTQDTTFVYLQRKVDQDVADSLSELLSEKNLTGVYFLADTKRVYPYEAVGAQVLGYVDSYEGTGLSGLEYQYDELLSGTDGQMLVETGLTGTPIAGGASQVDEAQNGTDIVVALDIDLQEACESIIAAAIETYDAESGSVMVVDPRTGEVLAACSTPLPDFSDLTDATALNLKLVSSSFEPGSVFKVLTTSIGFDLGLFTPDSTYSVPTSVLVGDDYVTDDDSRDYTMDMTVREMLRRSSNIAMAMLVQDVIGAERFSEGVARYGIGEKTGIDFPGEEAGLVKTLDEYDGATAGSMAFGQAVAVPMVQVVRAFATVANGGIPLTPHFLVSKGEEEVAWPAGERVVSADACSMETDVMRTVMQEGTGMNGQVDDYDIAGKTGTGEQASAEGGYESYSYVASLCGFANASDPEVLVYVGLNGLPHLASQSSALVFHDVMSQAVSILGVTPAS